MSKWASKLDTNYIHSVSVSKYGVVSCVCYVCVRSQAVRGCRALQAVCACVRFESVSARACLCVEQTPRAACLISIVRSPIEPRIAERYRGGSCGFTCLQLGHTYGYACADARSACCAESDRGGEGTMPEPPDVWPEAGSAHRIRISGVAVRKK